MDPIETETFEKKYLFYPEVPVNSDFVAQVERIISEFPPNTFVLKWIKLESEDQVFCQAVITNQDFRRDILCSTEEHFSAGCDAIEGYIVTKDLVALLPFERRNGTEVSRSVVTFD